MEPAVQRAARPGAPATREAGALCAGVASADWPRVTVVVLAGAHAASVRRCLQRLLLVDYPEDRLRLLPVNDHGPAAVGAVLDAMARRSPARVRPLHRCSGAPGRAAALRDALLLVETDLVVVCDARLRAGRGFVADLMRPFFDPEVGAVDGIATPRHPARGGAARQRELQAGAARERALQGRGTAGDAAAARAVRLPALQAIGSWRDHLLSDPAELAWRLQRAGWTVQGVRLDARCGSPHEGWARGPRHVPLRRLPAWAARLRPLAPALALAGWGLALALVLAGRADAAATLSLLLALALPGLRLGSVVRAARREGRLASLPLLAFGWTTAMVDGVAAWRALWRFGSPQARPPAPVAAAVAAGIDAAAHDAANDATTGPPAPAPAAAGHRPAAPAPAGRPARELAA